MKTSTDQTGTVHNFDFDKLGRPTQDRVPTLGSGVDGAVRRIATAYEVRGMRSSITSHDNATVGSGSVLDQSQFEYNDFGQLKTEYQEHSGAVNTSTSPKVQYGHADGSDNTIRPTSLTYPDGRELTYDYGSSGGEGDALSRIESIVDDDSTRLVDYAYLGLSTFVEADYTQPDLKYTLIGTAGGNDPDTGDIYLGLDRFGRVKDSYWRDYGSSTDADRIKYGYDRNGGRIWRQNTVASGLGEHFDELYDNDQIDRLLSLDRGDLGAGKDSISNLQFAEQWGLDETGNWRGFRQDDDGSGWDLDQRRTANVVNEITDITETTGPSWATPAYSAAGNMTSIPKPSDATGLYTATYDAWNRLVKVASGATTVAEYRFDGARRRIVVSSYTAGSLAEVRHAYFTEPSSWQVLEERASLPPTSPVLNRQFVWGLRYIDDCVLRDRDTDGNGTLDERLYALQDANWNVTSLADTAGDIQERYAYSAYGAPLFLTASFTPRGSSSYAWERLFAGYVFDSAPGWYCVRNRGYVAGLGWVQRDPLGYVDGVNLQEYCCSNPITTFDPLGLNVFYVGLGGCALGGAVGFFLTPKGRCAWNISCRVAGGCLVGAAGALGILAAIRAKSPAIGICVAGTTAGLLTRLVPELCDCFTREGNCNWKCAVLDSIYWAFLSCALAIFKEAIKGTGDPRLVATLLGIDLLIYRELVRYGCGLPNNVQRLHDWAKGSDDK